MIDSFRSAFESLSQKKQWSINNKQYSYFINHCERKNIDNFELQGSSQSFLYRPRIGMNLFIRNGTKYKFLHGTIESVLNQSYENWELYIAVHESALKHANRTLKKFEKEFNRIKIVTVSDDKVNAEIYNQALEISTGDYVGFIKPDDVLAPFTLSEVVKVLNKHRDLHLVYSDEDIIDKNGNRSDPFFKPDWSPDHFLSQDFISRFYIIRKSFALSVGGFCAGFEGSEHYDFLLRCTEKLVPELIAHIPKVLYHQRNAGFFKSLISLNLNENLYVELSAKKALEEALVRRNLNGEVFIGVFPGTYRIRYAIKGIPKISIIIPSKDNVNLLRRCIESIIKKTDYNNYEIVIVDNQSIENVTFAYYESLKQYPQIRILHCDTPFNFSKINNYAVSQIDSPFLVFLNNDTEVITSEWLSAMLEHAQRTSVGAVGAKLLYPNNRMQHAGIILGMKGYSHQSGSAGHAHKHLPDKEVGYYSNPHIIRNYSAVTAACLMVRREVFQEINGFNEEFAVAFNDVDLCLKMREKGYFIVYTPYAKLYHHESYSRGFENTQEKMERFNKEKNLLRQYWGEVIDRGDPFYNINLALIGDFSHRIREFE